MKYSVFIWMQLLVAPAFSQGLDKEELDQFLTNNRSELVGLKKGLNVKVMSKNEVLYQFQFGTINDDTAIPIASASKWLSGALIMKLVDEKLISLNDPLKKFFQMVPQDKADITIQQLFSHTSGMSGKGTLKLIRMNKDEMAEQCETIFKEKLIGKPGEYFSYGGHSMQVAGRIAELVGKKDFETLFQEKIAKPLEMKNTTFTKNEKTPQVGGGAHSSVNDYLNLLNMIMNKGIFKGKRVLSEVAVNQLLANQIGNAKIEYSPFTKYEKLFTPPIMMKYGIGNWREEDLKTSRLKISSSPGAFGFTPWIDFEHQYCGVLATVKSMKEVFPVYIDFRNKLNAQLK